jgi:hypothetical protein
MHHSLAYRKSCDALLCQTRKSCITHSQTAAMHYFYETRNITFIFTEQEVGKYNVY